MHITAERAFWIFDYYRSHSIRLVFGGTILGEEGACRALISDVWTHNQAIGLKLLSEGSEESWDRVISFTCARFYLIQMGDIEFERFKNTIFHSILVAEFSGGATVFFAEPFGATAHLTHQKPRITCPQRNRTEIQRPSSGPGP